PAVVPGRFGVPPSGGETTEPTRVSENIGLRINRKSKIENPPKPPEGGTPNLALVATTMIALFAAFILWRAWPRVDHSTSPLSPRHSPAQEAFTELQTEMNHQGQPVLLIVSGRDEAEVARHLDAASAHLAQALSNQEALRFMLPTYLWPH